MYFFDFSFWQSFVSNALATIIEVVLGILGALWINGLVKSRTEKEKKTKILNLLIGELQGNYSILNPSQQPDMDLPPDKRYEKYEISVFLRDEVWTSLTVESFSGLKTPN